ncbi:MAG: nicotinate-nucleotide adenylyltransferase [Acidimicrobiales bacterium]
MPDAAPPVPARRVGVFGGTFDPPHIGHLVTALNVRHALALDEVLLVVANRPWQKEGTRALSAAEDRFALVAAAVAGIEGLSASRIELDRGGPSYTVDTLRSLEAEGGVQLFTILGADAAALLPTWERPEEVVARSRLVVVDRPGHTSVLPEGLAWIRVEVPHLEVSSSDLRARVLDGRPLEFLLPDAVIAEIRARGLYRGPAR